MQNDKEALEALIEKYLHGQLDADEKKRLLQWMHDLDVLEGQPFTLHEKKAILKQQIDQRLLPIESPTKVPFFSKGWIGVAASLLFFVVAGVHFLVPSDRDSVAVSRLQVTKLMAAVPMVHTVKNTSEKDSVIQLLDGTRVRLLANSTLIWKIPFESYRRDVELVGKAFFEVAHDHRRPFSVLSGNIITTALGTSFWVEQSAKNGKPRVRLVTGKVSIKQRMQNGESLLLAYLTPGEQWVEKSISSDTEIQTPPMIEVLAEPMVNSLFFHHKPLPEVLPALAAYYQTDIQFSEKEVENMSFYGSYNKENDVETILKTICIANDLTLEWNENQNSYIIRRIN